MYKRWIACGLIALLLAGVVIAVLQVCKEPEIGEFNLSDYTEFMEQFPSGKVLGPVLDAKTAQKVAYDVWTELYGSQIDKKKPYTVSYDASNEVWLVHGTLPPNYLGGVPYILILKADGKVLAVWHDK